ncbi:MAG TPA: hypothetical protein PLQ42_12740 [Candidatus Hydrogenedentes bacterium]|jgi:hypothetical protein|nr:hypothetical protein [Candidatus Hydrogenedentota bacterium]HOR51935.1 hypothetical protein [Candidatus Hydrogenedentota bacterium]HPK25995.1 hypothetical protein [Candidatus Hydrogenedentota bacterium]HPX87528.1 hypothetical protein [Candidatus Hydrogenedentota bacterium]
MELDAFVFSRRGTLAQERATGAQDEEDVMAAVNRFTLKPLKKEEVALFTLDLCNNKIDRHFSRFPEEELEKVNRLTPGRPLMERHDLTGTLPRGTFFRSQLHHEGGHISVRPEVYVLRIDDNRDFILNIEGGVYRETSISFSFRKPECSICGKDLRRCSHIPGRQYGDALCHFIMRDVVDVVEGSVVSAGSQGTGFVSQERAIPMTASAALNRAREEFHRPVSLWSAAWALE